MLETLTFFMFSGVLIVSALMVVLARNPVHAVLFLILCFFNAAGLFILLGAEFLAMILVIVYVGAVAVLFLFVVMMLDIGFSNLKRGLTQHLPLGIAVALVFFAELAFFQVSGAFGSAAPSMVPQGDNTRAIGMVLYTDYIYPFQISGMILLLAMIGAIVLTLRHKPDAKRQDYAKQLGRRRQDVVRVVKIPSGQGVE
ncbi:MAG: NADH-quinone oxidoreductase subunit J [Alphaproteobacteria bacterium]